MIRVTQAGSLALLLGILSLQGCFLFHEVGDPPSAPDDPPPPIISDAGPMTRIPGEPYVRSCLAQDVRFFDCDDCDGATRAYWNGAYCEVTNACNCLGPDCDELFESVAACIEANIPCVSELCVATGGDAGIGCGDARCGVPDMEGCLIPGPICDCPADSSFVPTYGCVPHPICGAPPFDVRSLCEATGGEPDVSCCPSPSCGEGRDCEETCPDPNPICRCGPFETFSERLGCMTTGLCTENGDPFTVSDDCGADMLCTGGSCSDIACAE